MQPETMLNLRWDFFSSHLSSTLDYCYEKQHFVDLSLVCKNNVTFKCHKMILSATSGFFRRLLMKNDHPHPLIILHDIDHNDLKLILNFMYYGEIQVPERDVKRLIKIAQVFDIHGLKDIKPTGQLDDDKLNFIENSPLIDTSIDAVEIKNEPISPDAVTSNDGDIDHDNNFKNKITPVIKIKKPQLLKNNYNLRQRTTSNLLRDNDFVMDNYRVRNNKRKSNNNNNSNDKNSTVIINETNAISDDKKVDVNNYKNDNKCFKNNNNGFKKVIIEGKNNKKLDNCNYLKKLKLLDEVEIIFQPAVNDASVTMTRFNSNSNSNFNDNDNLNSGIFIKDEVDISMDDFDQGNKTKADKKISLGPGVEIFKTYPKNWTGPSTSSEFC
ncbi:putative uncharacterized protein DDB_G0267716 [Microplitis mediator]|uniref:putative uncharacterized protein DDB_G0267716 n=1 Tax=Microplitis mediator TaxID=375433 RepID=UPI0025525D80|nr:putative uncharacterized protein DDB_G0267716 [Microplitis mediator]